mgnify:CR=1 FL=1
MLRHAEELEKALRDVARNPPSGGSGGGTLAPASGATQLIVNGGFEAPVHPDGAGDSRYGASIGQYSSMPGWTSPESRFEIWRAAADSASGQQFVELDHSSMQTTYQQSVATTAGEFYLLSLAHTFRPNESAASSAVEVRFDGTLLDVIDEVDGRGLGERDWPDWKTYRYEVQASGSSSVVALTEHAEFTDFRGAMVDDVSLLAATPSGGVSDTARRRSYRAANAYERLVDEIDTLATSATSAAGRALTSALSSAATDLIEAGGERALRRRGIELGTASGGALEYDGRSRRRLTSALQSRAAGDIATLFVGASRGGGDEAFLPLVRNALQGALRSGPGSLISTHA